MFQFLAKYPVSVFLSSWTMVSAWTVKPGFISSFPLPPSTMAGESDLMDKLCRSSLLWSTPPFYQPDVTEVKVHFFNRLSISRGRREGAPTANGKGHCLAAEASSGQFLNLPHEAYCVLNLHRLKQRNLLTPTSATDSVTPNKSFNVYVPQLLFSMEQRYWDPWRFMQIHGVRK